MKKALSWLLALAMVIGMVPISVFAAEATESDANPYEGKSISILGDSISTFAGVSNNPSYNPTLSGGAIYYNSGTLGVSRSDTWWQQTIDVLGMELLVNNSWSGSTVLHTRSGTAGAYVDRCVQLHNTEGEDPDVIAIFLGTNDFSYYQSALGTADIDYTKLITDNGDGTYTYATPKTTCEAYAVMLHKMVNRYPDAEVYCMNLLPRRDPDHDGKDVVPAPTQFNGELEKVISHFGCTVVDLENCGITPAPENFDRYITDQQVHPGPLGMDKMTQALINAMMKQDDASWMVSRNLVNVKANASGGIVLSGDAYSAVLTANTGFDALAVTVTMGGKDITAEVYKDGVVNIPAVTGDVVITASASIDDIPDNYYWKIDGNNLVSLTGESLSANSAVKKTGSITNGVINSAYFSLEKPVILRHDREWTVEWRVGGTNWAGMLFSANSSSAAAGNSFLFKTTQNTGFIGFGEPVSGTYHNYGVALEAQGVNTGAEHTYRVENRVAEDGTNMAYLSVDGVDYGPMNHYFIGGNSDQGKQVNWLNGRDFCFSCLGSSGHSLNNCDLDYIAVWENGQQNHAHSYTAAVTAPTCTEPGYTTYTCDCGDSYVDDYVETVWHTYSDGRCGMCGDEMLRLSLSDFVRYQGGVNSVDGTLNTTFTNNWYADIRIPGGAEQVRFLTFKTGGSWGSVFQDGSTYLSGFCDKTSGGYWKTIDVPEEATTFRYGYLYDEIAAQAGYPTFAYVEFVGEELTVQESSGFMDRPATGCHAFTVKVNIAPAQGNADGYVEGTDYGYIQLPTNYTAYGEPTRLIIVCHGAGANLSTYQSSAWKTTNYSFWTDLGYAVMDMYASPTELAGDEKGLHYGSPIVVDCYKEGYDYVMEHFNLKQDGVFLIGASMGGLSSFQIAQSGEFPVVAQVGYCPVIDTFKQAYVNPWTTASYQRSRIAEYFGFTGTAPAFTNNKYPSAEEIEYYKDNFGKTVAYSPILSNVVSGDMEAIFDVIPSSATATSESEAALYQQLTAAHPNPLMIFHNTDDSTVSYRYSQYFVDMVNRSGQEAKLYTFTSGAHNAWANGASVTVQGINGQITIKESQYEAYKFFEKFEKHEEHQPWVDPAVAPTCTETGLTQGSHCAVCGVVTVEQEIIAALGHSYTAVVTAPTCTEQGYTTYTCDCGDSYVDDYVDATGEHDFGGWMQIVAPTCNAEGQDKRICENCGDEQYRDTRISGDPDKILVSNSVDEDFFSGKTLLLIGDSITCGVGVSDRSTEVYGQIVGKELGMNVTNKGVSGSGYCSGGAMSTNKTLTETNVRNADVITIMLGVNDWTWAVKDGSWNGNPEYYDKSQTYYQLGDFGSTDTSTLYGALHSWCQNIVAMKQSPGFEDKQFVVITPLITSWNTSVGKKDWNQDKVSIHGHTFREHCTAIMEVCAYYDIPVFDANMFSGIYYKSAEDNNVAETGGDGVHVNAAGHALLAEALEEFLLDGYTYELRSVNNGGHAYVDGICIDCRLPYDTCDHTYSAVVTTPTCTEQGYTTYTCTTCGDSYVDDRTDKLGHDEQLIPGKSATCTESGLTDGKQCSRCGVVTVEQEIISELGHSYGEWYVSKAPTYTEAGEKRRDCVACDHFELGVLAALKHSYTAVVTEPTCTEDGYTTYTCTECGDSYVDDRTEKLGHDEELIPGKAATCTETGLTDGKQCRRCGVVIVEQKIITALGHSYDAVVTKPICTEDGYTTYTCTACGDSYVDDRTEKLGHDEQLIPGKRATCTESGLTDGKQCRRCGVVTVEQEIIAARGHSYEAVITKPTCTEDGYTTYTCTECGDSYVDDRTEKLGHNEQLIPGKAATCTENGLTDGKQCRRCGVVTVKQEIISALGHGYTAVVTVPTCTEDGYTTYTCTTCGDSYVDDRTEKLGHSYEAVITKPTCTEDGYTTYTCTTCGDSYVDDRTDKLGHDEQLIPGKAATCTERGLTDGKQCRRCGVVTVEQEIVAALGHSYTAVVTEPTCTEGGYTTYTCTTCGDSYVDDRTEKLGHDEQLIPGKSATCTESGLTDGKQCRRCGVVTVEQAIIAALGHSYTAVVTAPTCTEEGYTTYTCTACGDSYVDDRTEKLGHDEKLILGKAATCTESGLTDGKQCRRCGVVTVEQKIIEALSHSYTAVVTAPTCTEGGYATYTCTACGDSYVDDRTDKLGHDEQLILGKAATCTETGLTDGKQCAVCGEILVAQSVIDATGHSFTDYRSDNNATDTEDGTKTAKCDHCDATDTIVDEGTMVKHTPGKWKVTKKATCVEPGLRKTTCVDCGKTLEEILEPHGEAVVKIPEVPATCTKSGKTAKLICSECGKVVQQQKTIKKGHLLTELHFDESGHWYECEREDCDSVGKTSAHKYDVDSCEETASCEVCEYEKPAGEHIPGKWRVTKKATCVVDGLKTATCTVCKEKLSMVIEAHGEAVVEIPETPATCTENGKTAKLSCSECGKTVQSQKTIKKGHLLTELHFDESGHWYECEREDCDAVGKTANHKYDVDSCEEAASCEVCGYEKPAGEHIPGKWKVSKKATCVVDGLKTAICTVCKEKISMVIEAHGEVVEEIPETPATCTENGKTAKLSCSECGKVVQQQKTIKKGHLLTELHFDESGHWYECERDDCDAVGKTSAHRYKSGVCKVCGWEK